MHSFSWQGTVPAKINLLGALHCIEIRSSCFPTKLWKWSSNSTQQELSLAYSIPSPASSWVYLGASSLFSYMSWSWTKWGSSGVHQSPSVTLCTKPVLFLLGLPKCRNGLIGQSAHLHINLGMVQEMSAVSGTEGWGWARARVKRWKGTSWSMGKESPCRGSTCGLQVCQVFPGEAMKLSAGLHSCPVWPCENSASNKSLPASGPGVCCWWAVGREGRRKEREMVKKVNVHLDLILLQGWDRLSHPYCTF